MKLKSPSKLARTFRVLLFGGFALGTLIALGYAGLSYWARGEWAAEQRDLRSRGESLKREDFNTPMVEDKDNFFASPMWNELADVVERPARDGKQSFWAPRIEKEKLRIEAFGKALGRGGGSALSSSRKQTILYSSPANLEAAARFYREKKILDEKSQSAAEDILTVLGRAQEMENELIEGSDRPAANFYDSDRWKKMEILPPLTYFPVINQYLQLKMMAEAELGQGEKAEKTVLLALRLTDTLKTDYSMIAQLVRISNLLVIPSFIWEGIYRQCWSQSELNRLRDEFSRVSSVRKSYIQAIRAERAYFVWVLEPYARAGGLADYVREAVPHQDEDTISSTLADLVTRGYPTGLIFDDITSFSRFAQRLVDALEKENGLSDFREIEKNIELQRQKRLPIRIFSRNAQGAFIGALKRVLEAEVRVRQAQIACILESDRLQDGEYPDILIDLPKKLCDPVNGQPFHYRKTTDGGYELWSVAYNERDDNAVPDERVGDTGDWVWKMPGRKLAAGTALDD